MEQIKLRINQWIVISSGIKLSYLISTMHRFIAPNAVVLHPDGWCRSVRWLTK